MHIEFKINNFNAKKNNYNYSNKTQKINKLNLII